ncbi:MAG TPA: type II toxin-antitoxin system RelE/ParE family toxin [Kiritimatiellia bacterium]|nr:type II toxin-antitoxin system RelE/ParE family toxin [Kiritimatiellia bacterium]HMP34125.1 type II toxin-antitoxin system RelE/ParE family toxin [Kiritimatiellia bacterium]
MTNFTFLHEAEVELWAAVTYYEERSPGLGLDFQTEIEQVLATIAAHPERCPLRTDGTRRCLAHRFPYLVVYTCENDHIWLLAVAHAKRRPGFWRMRGG